MDGGDAVRRGAPGHESGANRFNFDNFANPAATLPNALPTNSLTESNKVQPGQPYTPAAATFGQLQSTVGRTVGLGTSRQIQFAFRLNF